MDKITAQDVPYQYGYCTESDCPVAGHCLRYLAMQAVTKDDKFIRIVNPKRVGKSEKCEFYRSAQPQVFGKGFTKMQQEMLPRQYDKFMRKLRAHFGRTAYFDRRRGERICTPSEVAYIRKVLASLGLQNLDFDEYVEQYVW